MTAPSSKWLPRPTLTVPPLLAFLAPAALMDRVTGRLVFHDYAEGIIRGRTLTDEDVREIVAEVLARFPPD